MAEKIFMKGCEAVAETAVRAGCRFFAGSARILKASVPRIRTFRGGKMYGFAFGET